MGASFPMNDSPEPQSPRPLGKFSRRLVLAGVLTGAMVVATGLLVNIYYIYQVWHGLDTMGGAAEADTPRDMSAFFGSLHYSQMIAVGVTMVGLVVLVISLFALPRRK